MAKKWQCQIGTNNTTKMLCTKINIYIKFPVDIDGILCHNVDTNMIYLSSKIFHESLLVNMLVNLQAGKGTPREYPMGEFFDLARSMDHVPLLFAPGAWLFHTWCFSGQPKCTVLKISPKIRGSIQLVNNINLKFKSMEATNLPVVNLFFTSEKNAHGAVWYQWMEGDVFAINIDPQDDKTHSVTMKQQTRKKLPETSYCSLNLNYYECLNMK